MVRGNRTSSVLGFVVALWAACFVTPAAAQREVYYDQFDWGMAMGDPGGLNLDFWKGDRRQFRYDPRVEMGSVLGAARVGNGGIYAGLLGTGDLSRLLPANDYDVYFQVRLTDFQDSGTGERNAEIAFRSDTREGYLLTVDGLGNRIRLRRQGGGYGDLVRPVDYDIRPGDTFYFHVAVRGTGPVDITAQVATDPSFSPESLIFNESAREKVWIMNNREIVLVGFTPEGPFTFDYGYFSIGETGYDHPPSAWGRPHYLAAPPTPEFVQLGRLVDYDVGTTSVIFRSEQGALRLVPRLEGTVRMDFSPAGSFGQRDSWSVSRQEWPEIPFTVTDGDPVVVQGPAWRVDIERDPIRIVYKDPDGTTLLEHPRRRAPLAAGPAREVAFSLKPGEDLYGFGTGAAASSLDLSRRGFLLRVLSTRQRLSHTIMPFWVSTGNYGVFVDNPTMGWLDLGFGDPAQAVYSSDDGELTWYVILGDSMHKVLEQYSELVGRPGMPPRWSLGNVHLSTKRDSISDVHRLIEEFQIRALPLDALTIDSSQVDGLELPQSHMDVRIVSMPQVEMANGQADLGGRAWLETEGGLGGIPHWNPDLGSYWGEPSGEVYLRWVQFAPFKPLFQPRGRETIKPWSYGPEIEAAVREALELRYRLLPYHYTMVRKAHDSGIPVLRPLVMEWPEDPKVRNLGTEFLFGPQLLARPITEEHSSPVEVYLPEGRWFDWFSGKAYEGPVTLQRDGAGGTLPLYVRAPAIIPLGRPMMHSDEAPLDPVTLRIWPPKRGRTVRGNLYEDDGISDAYKRGEFATATYDVEVAPQGKEMTIRIGGEVGRYRGQPATRWYLIEIRMLHGPAQVLYKGQALSQMASEAAWESADQGWFYDKQSRWLYAKGTHQPIGSPQEFVILGDPVSDWNGWLLLE